MSSALGNIDFTPLIPELTLTGGFLLLIIIDLFQKRKNGIITASGGSILLIIVMFLSTIGDEKTGVYLFGSLVQDGTTVFFRILFCLAGIISLGLLAQNFRDEAEPYLLILASIIGMFFLAGANDIITLFVAIEMVSIPSYVLAGYKRKDAKSAEAALKYVLYGAVSSGIMLFGFSLLYGISGSTNIAIMSSNLVSIDGMDLPLAIGLIMVLVGIGYKIAIVPVHFWCPDVYEGSPTAITAYFSVVPKAAGFAALYRLMVIFTTLDPVYGISAVGLFTAGSALTMTFGNLGAIWQDSVKRLLAYSSIAHAGYILMGFAALAAFTEGEVNRLATSAILFYLVVYTFMNLGAFLIVGMVERNHGSDSIQWFRGLGKSSSLAALAMAVFLFSLIGLPPLAGFIGKFYLLAALVKGKLFTLAFFAIANTVISLYYYVRIAKAMYLDEAETSIDMQDSVAPRFRTLSGVIAIVTVVPTVVLGIFWGQLSNWIQLRVW